MKVFITGGTGLIGKVLVKRLLEKNFEVTVLTRNIEKAKDCFYDCVSLLQGDPSETTGNWQSSLSEADIVINLAGESITTKRWTEKLKKTIYDSRVKATKNLVEVIKSKENKPQLFINASAVGFYGSQNDDREINENETSGNDFLATLCSDSEFEATKLESVGVRVVKARIGIVLSDKGGALEKMLIPFKMYAGGYIGTGKQWLPWIHLDDIIGLFLFCIDNKNISGAVNFTSPNPVKYKDFAKVAGTILKRPSSIPTPKSLIKVGFGEVADVLASGQRAIPQKALQNNYEFEFPSIEMALKNLLD